MKRKITLHLLLLLTLFLVACAAPAQEEKPAAKTGGVLSDFTTTDLDNQALDHSVFAGKKMTMVNIWTTYCGYCLHEMPALGQLNQEYADRGFQVIGIPLDANSTSSIQTAKEIVEKTNADYLHLLPSQSLVEAKLNQVTYVPETFFVDENGAQVGQKYVGPKDKQDWAPIIEQLLEQEK